MLVRCDNSGKTRVGEGMTEQDEEFDSIRVRGWQNDTSDALSTAQEVLYNYDHKGCHMSYRCTLHHYTVSVTTL